MYHYAQKTGCSTGLNSFQPICHYDNAGVYEWPFHFDLRFKISVFYWLIDVLEMLSQFPTSNDFSSSSYS